MKKVLSEYFHKIYWEKKGKIHKLKAEYITGILDTVAMVGVKNRKVQVLLYNVTARPSERQVLEQKFKNITNAKKFVEATLEKDLLNDRYHKKLWS